MAAPSATAATSARDVVGSASGDGGDAGQLADGRAGGAAQRLLGERLLR